MQPTPVQLRQINKDETIVYFNGCVALSPFCPAGQCVLTVLVAERGSGEMVSDGVTV